MIPIQPEELSAFIDGELDSNRAEEIKNSIANDEVWRKRFDELSTLDTNLRNAASGAAFKPKVTFSSEKAFSGIFSTKLIAMVAALIFLRVHQKLEESFLFAFGLHIIALTAVIIALIILFKHDESPSER